MNLFLFFSIINISGEVMKKIIILVSLLFIVTIGVLLYNFIDSKNYFDKELIEINKKQVDIVDSKAINDLKINDVVLSDIHIEDNKTLIFNISASKTKLDEKIMDVSLYNDLAKNPGPIIEVSLSDVMEDGRVSIDISEQYNTPIKLEFDIK